MIGVAFNPKYARNFRMISKEWKKRWTAYVRLTGRDFSFRFMDRVRAKIPTEYDWQEKYRAAFGVYEVHPKPKGFLYGTLIASRPRIGLKTIDARTAVIEFAKPKETKKRSQKLAWIMYRFGYGKGLWAADMVPAVRGGYPSEVRAKVRFVGKKAVDRVRKINRKAIDDAVAAIVDLGYKIGKREFPRLGGRMVFDLEKSILGLEFGIPGVLRPRAHWRPSFAWAVNRGVVQHYTGKESREAFKKHMTQPGYKAWVVTLKLPPRSERVTMSVVKQLKRFRDAIVSSRDLKV